MDLVESIGIDVSDWANFKGGAEKAASNPKYCYEWSFEDHAKKLIVLNLWYENIEILDGDLVQKLNLRKTAENAASSPQSRRAAKMDFSLQKAARLSWPVSVIICERERKDASATKSSADSRLLDSQQWHVKSYNSETGDCLLVRGTPTELFIDQFALNDVAERGTGKRETIATVYDRNPQIRRFVLTRAKGHCEWCGEKGFESSSGSIYLETHHIQPLSEDGGDTVNNVIALCPNHHRESHFGINSEQFRKEMLKRVSQLNKSMQPTAYAAAD